MGAPQAFTATAEIGHYIAGRVVAPPAARRQPVYNPATGAVARELVLGTADDVDAAVAAGRAAFPAWADTPPRSICASNRSVLMTTEYVNG